MVVSDIPSADLDSIAENESRRFLAVHMQSKVRSGITNRAFTPKSSDRPEAASTDGCRLIREDSQHMNSHDNAAPTRRPLRRTSVGVVAAALFATGALSACKNLPATGSAPRPSASAAEPNGSA